MMLGRKMVLFVLGVTAVFVYICNAVPQIKTEAGDAEVKAGGAPEELAAAGRKIFTSDRAQCLTCHTVGQGPARCPDLQGIGDPDRASTRRSGLETAAYLVQSLYDPGAFLVSGFQNQMRPVHRPPIALSHDEILAVIVHLNTLGGKSDADFVRRVKTAQLPWRKGKRPEGGRAKEAKLPVLPGDAGRGRALFVGKANCIQCHRAGSLEPKDRGAAPDLTSIGAAQSPEYVLESILDPNRIVVKGYARTSVFWKEQYEEEYASSARGIALEWIPSKDLPKRLRLTALERDGKKTAVPEERDVDLAKVASVGNATLALLRGEDVIDAAGEYVSGDPKSGLVLRFLESGRWVERRIDPREIHARPPPVLPSPMRADFGDVLTPREIYDLVAFLVAQRGKR